MDADRVADKRGCSQYGCRRDHCAVAARYGSHPYHCSPSVSSLISVVNSCSGTLATENTESTEGEAILFRQRHGPEFRCKVRAVFPRQGVVGHAEGLECLRIAQGTEYRASELGREVDLAGGVVIETEPHDAVRDVSGFGHVQEHGVYSNGATEFSGGFSRASRQSCASSAGSCAVVDRWKSDRRSRGGGAPRWAGDCRC
jgi:hypothetical protein